MKKYAQKLKKFFHLNYCGLVGGTVLYCFALTPSLLPRTAFYAGLIAGASFSVGYALGVAFSWLARHATKKEIPAKIKRIAWIVLPIAMVVLAIAYGFWTTTWENEVRALVGETDMQGRHTFTIVGVAFVIASILIFIGRGIHRAINAVDSFVGRWLPARFSAVVGSLIVAIGLILLYNGVLVTAFVRISNNIYGGTNKQTAPGISQPQDPNRSGSPSSLVPWDTLGRQGRTFVGSGPTQNDLDEFSGQAAQDPIRVYVGLQSASDAQTRAALAVKELKRTGAFDRDVLAVMTATGTGWIEPQSADSLEYMWNGNTALVSIQYSYLPSWISFLVDRHNATEAGKALFDAVYQEWNAMPENDRPKLIAFGLSLGSFGGQAAFSGVDDMRNRTDGALFMGTPSGSQPWRYFTSNREKGSPEWQPIYQDGQTVRFAAQDSNLTNPNAPWTSPHVVYMQHASDPVVWWSPNLIWYKPDWLREPRGPDVSPDMKWYLFVTFAQVTVDQFFATSAPDGHGHNYGNSIVGAWQAVTQPTNWTDAQAAKLQSIIDTYPND